MKRGKFRRGVGRAASIALGGVLTLSVWLALHPGDGGAATTHLTVVDGFISQVETASPGEFPTPASAVKYLVSQVRTQNLAGATRVLPLRDVWDRETFRWQAKNLRSVSLNGFFPKQPLSKLASVAIGQLQNVYTFFGVELLHPGFVSSGVIIVKDVQAERALEAELDPSRLSGIFVASSRVTTLYAGPNIAFLKQLGVGRIATVRAAIGGIGAARAFDFMLDQVGGNWLVTSVSPVNP